MAGPSWTDIGGFWVAVLGFALAIVLAVAGLIQARGAKAVAKIAKDQADAALRQAEAAESAAQSARDQVDAARQQVNAAQAQVQEAQLQRQVAEDALDVEREPRLVLRYKSIAMGSPSRIVMSFVWTIKNVGRADALNVRASLDFPTSTGVHVDRIGDIASGTGSRLSTRPSLGNPASYETTDDDTGGKVPPTITVLFSTPSGSHRRATLHALPE